MDQLRYPNKSNRLVIISIDVYKRQLLFVINALCAVYDMQAFDKALTDTDMFSLWL